MFTPEQRARLRSDLLQRAADDVRISGAAITGSASLDGEDQWSDIDLAFGVADEAQLPSVLADWTAHLYGQHGALHHLDLQFGAWTYRVFILRGTLQVDLAFVPAAEFRAIAPSFRLVSGEAREARHAPPSDLAVIVGFALLYALHARTSIARRELWQAEYMISGVRDHALALACIRHGLSSVHARGIDHLPAGVTQPFEDSLVRHLDAAELSRAFHAVLHGVQGELRSTDPALAAKLQDTFTALSETATALGETAG